MADNALALELEIRAKFADMQAGLDRLRNRIQEVKGEINENLTESFRQASIQGSQLTNVLRQTRAGLVQLFSGNIVGGLLTIFQGFQRIGEQAERSAKTVGGAATQIAATGAAAAKATPSIVGMGGALAAIGGPIGVAVIAVLIAIALYIGAVVVGANKLIETAKQVGTTSREAFEKFRDGVVAAGGTVTQLDRQISTTLLNTLKTLQGALDRVFLKILEQSGPAMIVLLREIANLLIALAPAANLAGRFLAINFAGATTLVLTLRDALVQLKIALATRDVAGFVQGVTADLIANRKKVLAQLTEGLIFDNPPGFKDKGGKAAKTPRDAKDAKDFRLRELELERDAAKRIFDEETDDALRAFKRQEIGNQDLHDKLIAAARKLHDEKVRIFDEERALISVTVAPKLSEEERAIKTKEIHEKELQEGQDFNAKIQKINDELGQNEQHDIEERQKRIDAILNARIKLNKRLQQLAFERRDVELATERAVFEASNLPPLARIQEEARLQDQAEALKNDRRKAAIEADKQALLELATNEDAKLRVTNAANLALEDEAARHAQVMREIEARRRADTATQTAAEDPTSNVNLFGVIDETLSKLDALKEAGRNSLGTLAASVGTFGGLMTKSLLAVAGAAQQVLATFILTGKAGGAAFKQIAADVLASIVIQAGVKAIFELAEGIAAAANPFTAWMAPAHFAAAKLYAIVAGIAGGAALGIGAAGGLGGGGGSSGGGGGSFQEQQRPPSEIRIQRGDITGQIGGEAQAQSPLGRLVSGIERLNAIVETAAPGDVLTRGVNQRPEAIATGVRRSLASDAGFIRDVGLAVERG